MSANDTGATEYYIQQESGDHNYTEAGELTDTYMQTLVLADILDSNMELDTLQNETFLVAEATPIIPFTPRVPAETETSTSFDTGEPSDPSLPQEIRETYVDIAEELFPFTPSVEMETETSPLFTTDTMNEVNNDSNCSEGNEVTGSIRGDDNFGT